MRCWWREWLAGLLFVPALGGCATTAYTPSPDDPWQGYNRAMYGFNTAVDRAVLKPAAKVYKTITPSFVRGRVNDFFSNVGDLSVTANALLQAKPQALEDLMRFIMNSTFGLGGLFDVATPLGLPAHQDDIGMTLAAWGVPEGPYVILPFFGPSTLRNAPSPLVDGMLFNPLTYSNNVDAGYALTGLKFISLRASLLPLDSSIDEAYDPYAFVRNAYLQHRRYVLKKNHPQPPASKSGQLDSLQQELLQMQPDSAQ